MAERKEHFPGEDSLLFFEKERRWMVADQLKARGIRDPRVLEAMGTVPREQFVPLDYQEQAYQDSPLPIGFGQTISQPYAVAFMVEALQLTGEEKVLEIGTGSGYQAAVMAHVAREVHTIERVPQLYKESKERLGRLGYDNVHVYLANGTLGLPEEAPFDAIVVTASSEDLPPPYKEQLAEGGRILIPLGSYRMAQRMYRYILRDGQWHTEDLGGFAFVPLIGEYGWHEGAGD